MHCWRHNSEFTGRIKLDLHFLLYIFAAYKTQRDFCRMTKSKVYWNVFGNIVLELQHFQQHFNGSFQQFKIFT